MSDPVVIALALAAALVFAGIIATVRSSRRQSARREELLALGLTTRERVVVEKALPWFRRLPGDLRPRLEGVMRVLMDEKIFEACGGLPEVTDEMRLVICAQAGLLVVNRPPPWYPELVSILVYPGAFTAPARDYLDDAVEVVEMEERLGESSADGTVVLAWDAVLRGGSNHEDGLNLVMHEFAHQLDQLNGDADGAPILDHARDYESWSRVFHAAYGRHVEESERDEADVLDDYGAEDPAEFFAVATETFFERPRALHDEYPELFLELAKFYRLDPREWK
ncbi:MAG: zinc-dependent peptidase [Verrucomicrobiales bacterium]